MRGLEAFRARLAAWPSLTRDAAAAAVMLGSLALAQGLVLLLRLPVELFLAIPGLLLALWLFGRASAGFAALLTAAVMAAALDPAARALVWRLPTIPAAALAFGCAAIVFGVAGLAASAAARARAAARERQTRALISACTRDAIDQMEAARLRLARAEAEVAAARRQRPPGGTPAPDPIEQALRSEGGV